MPRVSSSPPGQAGAPSTPVDAASEQVHAALEQAVLELLAHRAPGATICPSEAARAVGGHDWRSLMEATRTAAQRLEVRAEVEITQGGRVVEAGSAKGPIRIRRRPPATRPDRVAR